MLDVAAVVLAAGRGERLGGAKLALPWGESTILGTVLATLAEAGLGHVVVVLGHDPETLAGLVAAAGAQWVINPDYPTGMLSSVRCGLAAVGRVDAALVMPGDLPLVRSDTVAAIAAAPAEWPLIIPTCQGERGHPLRLAATLFERVGTLDQEVGLRQLRERWPELVRYLEVDDPGIRIDIDTPADYAARRPVR